MAIDPTPFSDIIHAFNGMERTPEGKGKFLCYQRDGSFVIKSCNWLQRAFANLFFSIGVSSYTTDPVIIFDVVETALKRIRDEGRPETLTEAAATEIVKAVDFLREKKIPKASVRQLDVLNIKVRTIHGICKSLFPKNGQF